MYQRPPGRFTVQRVQTGVRIEKSLLKVLKGLAEYLDMTLGDLLEGIVLHAFEGESPFEPKTLEKIQQLKGVYGMDYGKDYSHRMVSNGGGRTMRRFDLAACLLMLAGALVLPQAPAAAQHEGHEIVPVEPFDAVFFERSRTIRLSCDPDAVFPLFTPEGRQKWSSFKPVMLRVPDEGWEGAVYLQPTIHEEPNTAIVADYDPGRRFIRYVTFNPRMEAWEMEIQVGPPEEGSYASVTYRVTGLTPEADPQIEEFFARHFEMAIDEWAGAIDRFLRH
jgi:hypothetical protein